MTSEHLPPAAPAPEATTPYAAPPAAPEGMEPFTPVAPEPFNTPPAPPARKSGGARGLNIALGVAVLIAACGVSFALGRATALASSSNVAALGGQGGAGPLGNGAAPGGGNLPNASFDLNGNGNGNGPGGFPGDGGNGPGFGRGGFGGPSVEGTVESVDGSSITLKLANGQTVKVNLNSSTTYKQQAAGSQSDVAAGKTVIVQITGRFDMDGQEGGSAASSVTVVP